MEVLFTIKLKKFQEEKLVTTFPDVVFHFDKTSADAEVETATAIVSYGSNVDIALLERAKSLEWLMVASAGIDKMPLAEIADMGIVVTNVRGIHKTPMAESVLAHILALKRALPFMYKNQQAKEWNRRVRSAELKGSTALILGPGAIGSEIGRLLQAFGVRTIGCNRTGKASPSMDEMIGFDELLDKLPEADYVISVLPSTPETRGLLKAEHFAAMKETSVFMNFGRGDLVAETVLVDALKNEEIGHAVLDVFETEPLPEENVLWALPNCTVSPHVSSLSGKYVERTLVIVENNLAKWLKGDHAFENVVDVQKGY